MPRSEDGINVQKITDTLNRKWRRTLFEPPVCDPFVEPDDIDDEPLDEETDVDLTLEPPELRVVAEIIKKNDDKVWVELVVAYDAVEDYEYQFDVTEVN